MTFSAATGSEISTDVEDLIELGEGIEDMDVREESARLGPSNLAERSFTYADRLLKISKIEKKLIDF